MQQYPPHQKLRYKHTASNNNLVPFDATSEQAPFSMTSIENSDTVSMAAKSHQPMGQKKTKKGK